MHYAGIGARKTPDNILDLMTRIASKLESDSHILRSGGANGADSAFEAGVSEDEHKEVYLPWRGFNGNPSELYTYHSKFSDIASKFHPNWSRLSETVRKLMIRNVAQVLGPTPDSIHSDFVICWTPDGRASGGTGQAVRIAMWYDITVYNLYFQKEIDQFEKYIEEGVLPYELSQM
jgi:hypothetical protein